MESGHWSGWARVLHEDDDAQPSTAGSGADIRSNTTLEGPGGRATLEWVAWCNGHRLLEPLGYVPPAEFEQVYYDRPTAPAELAVLTYRALRRTPGRLRTAQHDAPGHLASRAFPGYYREGVGPRALPAWVNPPTR